MPNLILTSMILLASQAEAFAMELPNYPVETTCGVRGAKFGAVAKKFCISEEQYARDRLQYGSTMPDGKPVQWNLLPDEEKTKCDDETRMIVVNSANQGGLSPYVHLENCIIHAYRVYLMKHRIPDAMSIVDPVRVPHS